MLSCDPLTLSDPPKRITRYVAVRSIVALEFSRYVGIPTVSSSVLTSTAIVPDIAGDCR